MTYKFMGRTGIKVSTIAYGTMSFGGDADEATSKALFGACRDAGVNLFDLIRSPVGRGGLGSWVYFDFDELRSIRNGEAAPRPVRQPAEQDAAPLGI